jgi:hypothetical protein
MVYYDDQVSPVRHYRIPYDPWNDPGYGPPVAPDSDEQRQAIRAVMDAHPQWSPSQIEVHLRHVHGYTDIPVAAIYGVKVGL